MHSARPLLPLLRRCRRSLADTGGLAAVEFAIVLPFMLTLWIGGVELTQGMSVDRRVNNMASMIGDLTSREKCISTASINEMFELAEGAMFPYSDAPLSVLLTAVWIDDERKVNLDWSYAYGSKAKRTEVTADFLPNVIKDDTDDGLRAASTQIIVVEAYYDFEPALGYVVTGDIELQETLYFAPRLISRITMDSC